MSGNTDVVFNVSKKLKVTVKNDFYKQVIDKSDIDHLLNGLLNTEIEYPETIYPYFDAETYLYKKTTLEYSEIILNNSITPKTEKEVRSSAKSQSVDNLDKVTEKGLMALILEYLVYRISGSLNTTSGRKVNIDISGEKNNSFDHFINLTGKALNQIIFEVDFEGEMSEIPALFYYFWYEANVGDTYLILPNYADNQPVRLFLCDKKTLINLKNEGKEFLYTPTKLNILFKRLNLGELTIRPHQDTEILYKQFEDFDNMTEEQERLFKRALSGIMARYENMADIVAKEGL